MEYAWESNQPTFFLCKDALQSYEGLLVLVVWPSTEVAKEPQSCFCGAPGYFSRGVSVLLHWQGKDKIFKNEYIDNIIIW